MTTHASPQPISFHRRRSIAGLLALGAGLAATALAQSSARPAPAPLVAGSAHTTIPDQYIVVSAQGTSDDAHHVSELIVAGSTTTWLDDAWNPTAPRELAMFTASVARNAAGGAGGVPVGAVQFTIDDKDVGQPVKLDAAGQAVWQTASLEIGHHQVGARFLADSASGLLPSSSVGSAHSVVQATR